MNESVALFARATPEHATETNTIPARQDKLFVFLCALSHGRGFTGCEAWAQVYA